MNHWDARAEALLAKAREQERVPADARHRVRATLAATVAVSAIAGSAVQAKAASWALAKIPAAANAAGVIVPAAAATSSPLTMLAPVAVGLALGLSAIAPSQPTRMGPTNVSAVSRAVGPTPAVRAPARVVSPRMLALPGIATTLASSLPLAAGRSTPVTSAAVERRNDLSEEGELLGRARLSLRQGDAELSLRLLERYEHEFPDGVLHLESVAMRAVASCRVGQTSAGLRLLAQLEATAPRSGFLNQVRAACSDRDVASDPKAAP